VSLPSWQRNMTVASRTPSHFHVPLPELPLPGRQVARRETNPSSSSNLLLLLSLYWSKRDIEASTS
jgi:hypothetical protein